MATKKPAAKKTTAKVSKPATSARKNNPAEIIFKERNPENHKITGKFKFFYCFFAATTLIFAIIAVQLFFFSQDIFNKYQSIEACTRAHTSCKVTYVDGVVNVDGGEE
ncbi:hypothetical protein J6X13_01250 [Candidatus Saccharibacteria bacterium]|nr:hypothetical protein [Candidatus Saccharibacteria bacterium]